VRNQLLTTHWHFHTVRYERRASSLADGVRLASDTQKSANQSHAAKHSPTVLFALLFVCILLPRLPRSKTTDKFTKYFLGTDCHSTRCISLSHLPKLSGDAWRAFHTLSGWHISNNTAAQSGLKSSIRNTRNMSASLEHECPGDRKVEGEPNEYTWTTVRHCKMPACHGLDVYIGTSQKVQTWQCYAVCPFAMCCSLDRTHLGKYGCAT
jgi:hypothetical protein